MQQREKEASGSLAAVDADATLGPFPLRASQSKPWRLMKYVTGASVIISNTWFLWVRVLARECGEKRNRERVRTRGGGSRAENRRGSRCDGAQVHRRVSKGERIYTKGFLFSARLLVSPQDCRGAPRRSSVTIVLPVCTFEHPYPLLLFVLTRWRPKFTCRRQQQRQRRRPWDRVHRSIVEQQSFSMEPGKQNLITLINMNLLSFSPSPSGPLTL